MDDYLKTELCKRAEYAKKFAYAPYSKYYVGAAILTSNNKIYSGSNIENASYPAGICAEISAASAAICNGERVFSAIAVAMDNGVAYPCGVCRQFLSEFIQTDIPIYLICEDSQIIEESFVSLFPKAFKLKDQDNE